MRMFDHHPLFLKLLFSSICLSYTGTLRLKIPHIWQFPQEDRSKSEREDDWEG